jgi:hypothetical protein
MRIKSRLALFLVGALAACGAPDPQHQSWKSADVPALQEALDSPTGTFETEDFEAFISELAGVLGPLLDTQALLDEVNRVASDLADAPDGGTDDAGPLRPNTSPPNERGTRFYLLLSCPGPNGDDVSFGHGSVRIDTPTLQDLSTAPLGEAGDFLLSYDACEGTRFEVNGSSPGYYDVSRDTLLLDYNAIYEDRATGRKMEYHGPLLYENGKISTLLGAETQNYRVSFEPRPSTQLQIVGATEAILCQFDPDALTITCQ